MFILFLFYVRQCPMTLSSRKITNFLEIMNHFRAKNMQDKERFFSYADFISEIL